MSGEEIETHRNAPKGTPDMLYGFFGEVGKAAAKNTEANKYAAAMDMMVYVSSCVGRGVYFYIGDTIQHVLINSVHIGRTSHGRKGDATGLKKRVIETINRQNANDCLVNLTPLLPLRHTGGLSTKEGLAKLMHDGYMDGKIEVQPINDKRLHVQESEFANVMQQAARKGNTLSAAIRDLFDGIGIQPAIKNNGIWASNPHVAIAGACTPTEILSLTTQNDISNGFMNRFIIFFAERDKKVAFPEPTPDHIVQDLADKLRTIVTFAKGDYSWDKDPLLINEDDRLITFSDEAKAAYTTLYMNDFYRKKDGAKIAQLMARDGVILERMAALFALSDLSLVIEAKHIKAAYAWVRYWYESVKYIFNDALEEHQNTEISFEADKILAYLKSKGTGHKATKTELSENVFNRHATSKAIDAALTMLLTSTPPQIEVIEVERKEGSNGRKPKFYALCERTFLNTPCELSEKSERTTAARGEGINTPCELMRINAKERPIDSQGSQSEIVNSQKEVVNSHSFASPFIEQTIGTTDNSLNSLNSHHVNKKITIADFEDVIMRLQKIDPKNRQNITLILSDYGVRKAPDLETRFYDVCYARLSDLLNSEDF